MEKFAQRGSELFKARQPKSFENLHSTRHNDSDMDFDDVFGGPPRRYSMQELKMRYSFCDSIEEGSENNNEENSTTFDPWPGLTEKPVFGEESVNRRRYVNGDFFDDIFKGDESHSSPVLSGSNPGSRISSPARPLPPKAEPFSTSLPSQFSLSPELTKASDSLGLTSDHGDTNKNEDAKSDGTGSPILSKGSFSKFLNRAMWGKHEPRADQYRQSPLSREASIGNLESLDELNIKNKDKTNKKNSEDVESPIDGSQFHFSIHKWAYGEIPLLIPLRERMTTKVEEESGQQESRSTQPESSTIEIKEDDERSSQDKLESKEVVKKSNFDISDVEIDNAVEYHAVERQSSLSYHLQKETQQSHNSYSRINVKKAPSPVQQRSESETKPLGALSSEKVNEQERNRKDRAEPVLEGKKGAKSANFSNQEKKVDSRKKGSKKTVISKISAPDSPRDSGDMPHKTGVKGKVRDFVKIFSPETAERSKASPNNQSQSCRWNPRENYGMDGEAKYTYKSTEEVEIPKTDKMPNAFGRTEENPPNDDVKEPSAPKNSDPSGSSYTEQKEASAFTESFKVSDESSETDFRESFSVEELSIDQDKNLQPSGDPDYIKVYDAKIKQWSQGRKGNIRSLLSTLQLVLWPESGWRPVPLMNIIEGSSVKKAYQRALLCLHPDKLQQKGAAPHQKYIAEKVFEILQEAWDHFNSIGAI